MKKIPTTQKRNIRSLFLRYGLHLWLMVFVLNVGIYYAAHFISLGKTCFTVAQVQSDTRCLYIWSGGVYEKGTRKSPHNGHPCGSDVTSVIPGSHVGNQARYLLPNNVGDICTAVVPTNTPVPTKVPTPTPTKVPTPTPTRAPGVTPSVTPVPTARPAASATIAPTQSQTQPTPTLTVSQPTATTQPVATSVPTATTIPSPLVGPGISFAFRLPGIGQATSNYSPVNTNRLIQIYVYPSNADVANPASVPVFTTQAQALYVTDAQSSLLGWFSLTHYDLGTGIAAGNYQIAFKTNQSVKTLIKDSETATTGTIFQLSPGAQASVSPAVGTVFMGDINNDNTIDILDYNLFVDCYGAKSTQSTCHAATTADLNDDGVIDGIDYNIMLRGIQGLIQQGKTPTLQGTTGYAAPTELPSAIPSPIPKVARSDAKLVLNQASPTQAPQPTTEPTKSIAPTQTPPQSLFAASNAISLTKIFTYISFLFLIAISILGAFKSRLITALTHPKPKEEAKPAK